MIVQRILTAIETCLVFLLTTSVVSYLLHVTVEQIARFVSVKPECVSNTWLCAAFVAQLSFVLWVCEILLPWLRLTFEFSYSILHRLYEATFVALARQLYLRGPSIHSFGFWAGRQPEDICSALTNVPASHWAAHTIQCETLISNQISGLLLFVQFGVALVFGYKYLSHLWRRYVLPEPTTITTPKQPADTSSNVEKENVNVIPLNL